MNIVAWIIIGLIAGWLYGMLVKGADHGVIGDLIIGALGAFLSGFVTSLAFSPYGLPGLSLLTMVVALLGALSLVALTRVLVDRSPI
jgi:uncharacterized membrane protein YeaQ/YmgE (transglycosylase-associated protein family)